MSRRQSGVKELFFSVALAIFGWGALPHSAAGNVFVWLDFTSDLGDGAGGPANGVADWPENLDALAAANGIAPFTPTERAQLEGGIQSAIAAIYNEFNISFNLGPTLSGPAQERIHFGAYSPQTFLLGATTQLDFMNRLGTGDLATPQTEMTSARVYVRNFNFFIEAADPREEILAELTAAIANTGGHELGHLFGLQHHHTYGNPLIIPESYSNTLGVQNSHLMATGASAISEEQRESVRTLSLWEKLVLETAGGAENGTVGTPLASTFLIEQDFWNGPDAGDTTEMAAFVPLTFLPISGMRAANIKSQLDHERQPNDIDVFAFESPGPARLIVEVLSQALVPTSFDPFLRLYDVDGVTELASNDDVSYAGNMWDNQIGHTNDSALLNILLPIAGTYYLEVQSAGDPAFALGGSYNLLLGLREVPEPATAALIWVGLLLLAPGRRPGRIRGDSR